jgi:hypothetical protein
MKKRKAVIQVIAVLCIVLASFVSPAGVQASADDPLVGTWYATWEIYTGIPHGLVGTAWFDIFTDGAGYYATVYAPALGALYEEWPVSVDGDTVYLGFLIGTLTGNEIQGEQGLPAPYDFYLFWHAFKSTDQDISIDPGPGPACDSLPPLYCTGSAEYCSELVSFDPTITAAYADYPINGETWDNQYRSYLRRDLMQLISYATAKLQCKTAGWDFGSHNPLGLIDMSESDGAIPGTSTGSPGHPVGTHTDGRDIDVAYYQFFRPLNHAWPVCDHYDGYANAHHCISQPYALDPWRTALFTAYLAEHPHLRVMGADGKIGPALDDSLDWFASNGWIDPDFRGNIPLLYEEDDEGYGFYLFHHHHMHISMNPVWPILLSLQFEPETLNLKNAGKYLTAYIELVDGFDPDEIDIGTVSITADGFSMVFADTDKTDIGDYDKNGIPDLMVKFDREAVQAMLSAGLTEITLYGAINGILFQGVDTILVR